MGPEYHRFQLLQGPSNQTSCADSPEVTCVTATVYKDVGKADPYALLLDFKFGTSCYMTDSRYKDYVPDDPTYMKCPD